MILAALWTPVSYLYFVVVKMFGQTLQQPFHEPIVIARQVNGYKNVRPVPAIDHDQVGPLAGVAKKIAYFFRPLNCRCVLSIGGRYRSRSLRVEVDQYPTPAGDILIRCTFTLRCSADSICGASE